MKYNDNGEIKDIKIKVVDTVPIGTVVDYEGTTIPSGWEKIDERKSFTITSDIVTLNERSRYIEEGNKITILLNLRTTTQLSANTKYNITTSLPISDNYYATTAYGVTGSPVLCGFFMIKDDNKIQITPNSSIASGQEIVGQLVYYKK